MSKSEISKSVGRPRSFDETAAIDCAIQVFWKRGFDGASLSELTAAMGIKPGSLYAAFGNKQELFRRALQRYLVTEVAFIQETLNEPTALAVAQRLLRESALFLSRRGFPRGCMTIQGSQVITEEGEQIHKELVDLRVRSERKLRDRLSRAVREGDLPENTNPDSLARFLVSIYQGMTIQSVNGASRKDLLDLAEVSLFAWPMTKAA